MAPEGASEQLRRSQESIFEPQRRRRARALRSRGGLRAGMTPANDNHVVFLCMDTHKDNYYKPVG